MQIKQDKELKKILEQALDDLPPMDAERDQALLKLFASSESGKLSSLPSSKPKLFRPLRQWWSMAAAIFLMTASWEARQWWLDRNQANDDTDQYLESLWQDVLLEDTSFESQD